MHSGNIHYQSTNGITQDSQGHWQGAKAITVSFVNKLELKLSVLHIRIY